MADMICLDVYYINRDKILYANTNISDNIIIIHLENGKCLEVYNTPYNREKLREK